MAAQLTILGTGGNGILSLSKFIQDTRSEVSIYSQTTDYGGAQGVWYRLVEYQDFQLSQELYGKKINSILPWGDLNKIIVHFFDLRFGDKVGKILDFRSDFLEEHLDNLKALAEVLDLQTKLVLDFQKFLETGFNYYIKNKRRIDFQTEKSFCFGYPWQDYLCFYLGGVTQLNKFYQQKEVLPKNLNIGFTSDKRQILVAKSQAKNYLGEDKIDQAQEALKPDSFGIQEIDQKPGNFNLDFLKKLADSDGIIIPPGSLANWVALLNSEKILKILSLKSKQKRLIWILNPSVSKNECGLQKYHTFFQKKGLDPVVLGFDLDRLKNQNSKEIFWEKYYKLDSQDRIILESMSQSLQEMTVLWSAAN